MIALLATMSFPTPVFASPAAPATAMTDLTGGLAALGYAGLGVILATIVAIVVSAVREAASRSRAASVNSIALPVEAYDETAHELTLAA